MSKIAIMRRFRFFTYTIILSFLFMACKDTGKSETPIDTLSSGEINISVDETYKPVIEEEIKVFISTYPEAKINVSYKAESEVIKDYLSGKARLILVARPLTKEEETYCEQKKIVSSKLELAKDAIAVVVNGASKDTNLSITQLQGIVAGVYSKKYTVVFDRQGSSTIRFIQDSLMKGQKTGNNLFAANGNKEVVNYVVKNPDALGFVGLSYISDTMDSTAEMFTTQVKAVAMMNDSTKAFYKPYQAYIALKLYPLSRKLMYIKNETYPGLGSGFGNFLASDKGQLIFAHARLFPLRMSIVIRDAAINNSDKQTQ
jgi:phosphate transport system substrate-binding protein